jgi:anthranilate phosphoribosyltransferase
VLEALGVRIDLTAEEVAACVRAVGIGFMFAPLFHPAMKHATPVRRELGTRTVFNVLGPLTNPAHVRCQVIGVAEPSLAPKMAEVLARLDAHHALVVHGHGGLDELSISGPSTVYEVRSGLPTRQMEISPDDVGLAVSPVESVRGGTAEENAAIIRSVLSGERGPRRDITLFNAGAALYAADAVPSVKEGVALAARATDSGAALDTLAHLVAFTRGTTIAKYHRPEAHYQTA